MEISIVRLQDRDAEELYQFEMENRRFFEEIVPSRGDDFFQFETFKIRHQDLLVEQQDGKSEFYLVRDNSINIVGRINLVDIDTTNNVAEVGFRVGENMSEKAWGLQQSTFC